MTNRTLCKTVLAGIFACAFLASLYSQSSQSYPSNQTQRATRDTAATADATTKAIEMNVTEVELGKIASTKATNPRVKEFAETMVKDHTDAVNELKTVSGAPSDVKPNAKHKQIADRLMTLSDAQFDREYMKTMVSEHQQAVRFLEQQSHAKQGAASTRTGANDLQSVATELLPTVQRHLQMAQEIQKELGSKQTSTPSSKPGADQRSKPTPNYPK